MSGNQPDRQGSKFRVIAVLVLWGTIERTAMRDAQTYKLYATECERIARTMAGEQRNSLLSIAEAWRELARDAERKQSPIEALG
jgi:hypothetical protein